MSVRSKYSAQPRGFARNTASRAETSPPRAIRRPITSSGAAAAAKCSAVRPTSSWSVTLQPRSTSDRTSASSRRCGARAEGEPCAADSGAERCALVGAVGDRASAPRSSRSCRQPSDPYWPATMATAWTSCRSAIAVSRTTSRRPRPADAAPPRHSPEPHRKCRTLPRVGQRRAKRRSVLPRAIDQVPGLRKVVVGGRRSADRGRGATRSRPQRSHPKRSQKYSSSVMPSRRGRIRDP